MNTTLRIVTPPASQLLAASDMKDQLRIIDDDLQTTLINDYINAAIEYIELQTSHVFNPVQYLYSLDRWPFLTAPGYVTAGYPTNGIVEFPRSPLSTVDSVQYIDTNGALQTLSPSLYIVDTQSRPGRLWPQRFTYWPITDVVQPLGVKITFTAGYTNAALIPVRAKQAVRFLVAHWHENRTPLAQTVGEPATIPFALQSLVRSLKI